MAVQLAGAEKLEGTYPFTIELAVKAYRINEYLHRMVEPSHREAFLADPEASFAAAGLTDEERDLIRRRDWRGLLHYGVIFFMLEKLGAVTGVSNLHIYAAMRGETLEAFQRTHPARCTRWRAKLPENLIGTVVRINKRADERIDRPGAFAPGAVEVEQDASQAGRGRSRQNTNAGRQEKADDKWKND